MKLGLGFFIWVYASHHGLMTEPLSCSSAKFLRHRPRDCISNGRGRTTSIKIHESMVIVEDDNLLFRDVAGTTQPRATCSALDMNIVIYGVGELNGQ
jgi:hypothetical protein